MPDVKTVLAGGTQELAASGSPRLDAEVLLGFAVGKDRAWLLAHPEQALSAAEASQYQVLITRRAAGESTAYLVGFQEFYGRRFNVTKDVLVPRPESEQLVELALSSASAGDSVYDVGTGSGCLAITLALEKPDLAVTGCDVSEAALQVAQDNAIRLQASVRWHHGDLLPALTDPSRAVVVANLPYVPTASYHSSPSIQAEPRLALDGGPDGLEVINRLLASLNPWPKAVLLEIDPSQAKPLTERFTSRIKIKRDLAGRDRFALILP